MIRVMLVDDLPYVRMGYSMMLSRTPGIRIVAQAGDGAEAIAQIERAEHTHVPLPQVVLMDARMPVMDGIAATREIVGRWPFIRVLLLTTYDQDDYAFGGLEAGASGFLLKDATVGALAEAIRAVADGDAVLTPRITRQVLERGVPHPIADARQRELRAQLDALTPRQREICALIARGMSNAEIAQQLSIEVTSVRRAISRILTSLDLRDRTQIAVSWYRAGV